MVTINGRTELAGVVGNPVAHSLSPAMHNAAYEHLGLNLVYVPLQVTDEIGLRRLVAAIPGLPFVGFNVTMPFKRAVLELCDEVAMAANMAGAVNTVHCIDGRLVGYNTDGRGLIEALESEAGISVAGTRVALIGAGGAAGSAFVSFVLSRVARVSVLSRDPHSAEELVDRMSAHLGSVQADAVAIDEAQTIVREADIIVNATPVGMHPGEGSPLPAGWVRGGQVVYDMVYGTSEPTALVSEARSVGAQGLDGLGMLVAQGATAIDIWNESKQDRAPRELMRRVAEAELAKRSLNG
jgi:shikimate dehydrogenase